jgi:hypothetical protein
MNVWSCNSTPYTFHSIIFNEIQGQLHFNILYIMLHAQVASEGAHLLFVRFNISFTLLLFIPRIVISLSLLLSDQCTMWII